MNKITKVMSVSVITNIFLSFLKIIIGFLYKSSALIADGVHSFSDLLTDFFAIIGNVLAKKPADDKHPYGHGKIEYLTSIVISLVILFLGFSIVSNSVNSKAVISSFIIALVSLITIILKYLLSSFIIIKGKKYKNNILIASGKESRADVISSLVVFVSAILSNLTKYSSVFKYSDKIAGIIVGILIIRTGFQILKENISVIIGEQEIKGEDFNSIREILIKNKNVKTIDELTILKFGHCYKLSIEVSMNPNLSLKKCHGFVEEIEKKIKDKVEKVEYITIHVNPYKDLKDISISDYENNDRAFVKKLMMDKVNKNIKKEEKYIDNILNKHSDNIKIVKKDNQKIGFINCYKEKNYYLLNNIYIKEKYRNQGIGYNIIDNLIKNKNKVALWIDKKNIKVINLYKNLGFEVIKEKKNRYFMRVK